MREFTYASCRPPQFFLGPSCFHEESVCGCLTKNGNRMHGGRKTKLAGAHRQMEISER